IIADALVSQLSSKVSEINSAREKFGAEAYLEVVLHISCDENISTPALGFTHPTVAFLSEVGAYIDIDTYRNH
ncbi:MAG: hypothetical protein KDA57_19900, partial [Planctomycetales bacterium]|nr:hypothetical protein [Planctomycetales bacterium]